MENKNHKILEHLKPDYPWKPQFIDNFKFQINTIDALKKKIEYYESKNGIK
jgi:hypothetical protein